MKQMWDKRYASDDYAYGNQPNVFFKEKIEGIEPGKMLLPAEGEGRNAVYAAALGWNVHAFDFSSNAKEKALLLSKKNKVSIQYAVHGMEESDYEDDSFDTLAFIYAHNPNRKDNHRYLLKFLKPGGTIILEAFSKEQINNNTGGPKDVNMLYSIQNLKEDFSQLSELNLWEEDIVLDEGTFHSGKSSVIRLIGKK
jgi:2-polyprenyl-3-methyl-5-hydroxy-6-metoxy-1,4-benzoquinol methylase